MRIRWWRIEIKVNVKVNFEGDGDRSHISPALLLVIKVTKSKDPLFCVKHLKLVVQWAELGIS